MSRHWNPRGFGGGRPRRRRPPTAADLKEVAVTVTIGLGAGLLLAFWPRPEAAAMPEAKPALTASVTPDPWAESRRSRAILEGQEAPPAPAGETAAAAPAAGPARAERAIPAAVRVIDGDTFDYGGVRIRVADIDTPEVHGRCAYETALAARATVRMRALLMAGPFSLESTGARDEDRYGRKLRIVTRGGRSLGGVLVQEGLARPWTGHREPWC